MKKIETRGSTWLNITIMRSIDLLKGSFFLQSINIETSSEFTGERNWNVVLMRMKDCFFHIISSLEFKDIIDRLYL